MIHTLTQALQRGSAPLLSARALIGGQPTLTRAGVHTAYMSLGCMCMHGGGVHVRGMQPCRVATTWSGGLLVTWV